MFPLADSEREEISAAFDEAERKLAEAAQAVQELNQVLKTKAAFVGNARINKIRNASTPVGAGIFELSVQRCKMLKFGAARALR